MVQINKTLVIILSTILLTISIWITIIIKEQDKKITSLEEQNDINYIIMDKALADSAQYWHAKSDSFKSLATNAITYATSLEKTDSARHVKLIKKINEIHRYSYSQSDHLSDSLLRAAGLK